MKAKNVSNEWSFIKTKRDNTFKTYKYLNLPDLHFLYGVINNIESIGEFTIR